MTVGQTRVNWFDDFRAFAAIISAIIAITRKAYVLIITNSMEYKCLRFAVNNTIINRAQLYSKKQQKEIDAK